MSRINFVLIPIIFILLLTAFAFFSPKLTGTNTGPSANDINELVVKRFNSIGNTIAHATFVIDAITMNDNDLLNEVITTLRKDEPEIIAVHFTNADNVVLASSDPGLVEKTFQGNLPADSPSAVVNQNGVFNAAFRVLIGTKHIGALYFQARPSIPAVKTAGGSNPLILAIGALFALLTFFITLGLSKNMENKLVEQINQRQEEVFKPKIESLKKEQQEAQATLTALNQQIQEAQQNLEQTNQEYAARKKEIESNPVVQSIEKLKTTEAELLKRITAMKEEEAKLTKENSLLSQKHSEIHSALEAEKKEEAALREKLDLIKKKILHLETSAK